MDLLLHLCHLGCLQPVGGRLDGGASRSSAEENERHRHPGIELLTPSMVHYCPARATLEQREVVLDAAYHAHPERLVRSAPKPHGILKEVWIHNPSENKSQ